ncbi:MAG: hypothetical protein A2X86_08660 [Bdellovibrionales bacterium GWA2_49_15]|nr:MAG: hypothetical protein A2X86_08660 [Bdellovibrionales bacterium GWA2_49_15]HAZ11165.1 hypothetical protein [Bdellovibrionales bacterium]
MKIFLWPTSLFLFVCTICTALATPCPGPENSNQPTQCKSLRQYFCSPEEKRNVPAMTDVEYQTSLRKLRTPEFTARLQGHIQGAIQEERALTPAQKQSLSQKAKDTHLVFENEDAMELGLSENALLYIKSIRILTCGLEGNVTNAMALYVENRRIISVCPGLVRKIVSAQQTSEEMADSLTFVLGHETGHFLFKEHEALYENFKDCLLDNPTHEGLAKQSTMNIFKIIFGELRVGPHLNEIVADYWGNRAMAQMMKSNTRAETFRSNYSFICGIGNDDDGEHPGLDYRFDFLTRNDPGIAEALQCPMRPGCRL